MQPVRPLQMAGRQIRGLILERRIGPDQAERQGRLNHEHRSQGPPAREMTGEHAAFPA